MKKEARSMEKKNLKECIHTPYSVLRTSASRGITTMLVVAFMGIFALILGTITSYVFEQAKYGRALYGREQAFSIAEAGLEYYKWFIAHNTLSGGTIVTNGTGIVSPYTYTVSDPEGGTLGSAAITATASLQCGVVQWIDLTSVGTASLNPGFPRTLNARYMRPSVASYSNIFDSNVWYGNTSNITGPLHANGGIRMDGTNNSDVTSPQSTWYCDSGYGCSPTQSAANGVLGSGPNSSLWKWGSSVSSVSFSSMMSTLSTYQTYAQSYGLLLNPTSVVLANVTKASFSSVGGTAQKGFHLVFNSDGTVSVYTVNSTLSVRSWHVDNNLNSNYCANWNTDYDIIASQTLIGTYTVPSTCGLIYAGAKVWIDGTVKGKVTLIENDSSAADIILHGNIAYAATDGTNGLTAVAGRNVIIPLDSPDLMSIRGIFYAKGGYYGRNFFAYYGGSCVDVPTSPTDYRPYIIQSTLTSNGTTISTSRPGVAWVDGSNNVVSGYQTRVTNYDRVLAFQPPPFSPISTTDYGLSLWREQ